MGDLKPKQSNPEPVAGPRRIDFPSLSPDQFEDLVHRLVLIQYPKAVKTAAPDGGADTLLPGSPGQWERAWQAKHFSGHAPWGRCVESLDSAREAYGIGDMTFCFSRNLTNNQLREFRKRLVERHDDVKVDLWDRAQLERMLTMTQEGQRVLNYFLPAKAIDPDALFRAARAGGEARDLSGVIDRTRAIQETLAEGDPYFAYPTFASETGLPSPPLTPGTMISVTEGDGTTKVRIDAVPRDSEAASKFAAEIKLSFLESEEGREAARQVHEAIRRGVPTTIKKGVEVTATRMPPLFEDHIGQVREAEVWIGPGGGHRVWQVALEVDTDLGRDHETFDLAPSVDVPEEWDRRFKGSLGGGLTVSLLVRRTERGGQLRVDFTYDRDPETSTRDQVSGLRLLRALHGTGNARIIDGASGTEISRHELSSSQPIDDIAAVLSLLESVLELESWTGQPISVPSPIPDGDAVAAFDYAEFVRSRRMPAQWTHLELNATQEGVERLGSGGNVVVTRSLAIELFDQWIPFAESQMQLPAFTIETLGQIAEDGMLPIRVTPADGAKADIELHLQRPGEGARKLVRERLEDEH